MDKKPFVTFYKPISGYKAVLMTWEEDLGFHTPWQTGHFAYSTPDEARRDAQDWASAEEIEY